MYCFSISRKIFNTQQFGPPVNAAVPPISDRGASGSPGHNEPASEQRLAGLGWGGIGGNCSGQHDSEPSWQERDEQALAMAARAGYCVGEAT
jgi:hypothetical protein